MLNYSSIYNNYYITELNVWTYRTGRLANLTGREQYPEKRGSEQ